MNEALSRAILDTFRSEQAIPEGEEEYDPENVTVKVVLSFDRRRRGGAVGGDRMARAARDIVAEGDEDDQYSIRLASDTVVRPGELRWHHRAQFNPKGKSIHRTDAWHELRAYLADLDAQGAFEI